MTKQLTYVAGSRSFSGYLATPTGAARAGILVFHGGSGLTPHEHERAERLAELGFAAYAPDLFGEVFADRARGMAAIRALVAEPSELRARAGGALAALTAIAQPVAAVGHCFGGTAALELARSGAAIPAVISFHGGLATRAPAAPGTIRAKILAVTGAADPFVPADQRAQFEAELSAARADWQLLVLADAQHGFTVPKVAAPGCAYDERADRRSWAAMRSLVEEAISELT